MAEPAPPSSRDPDRTIKRLKGELLDAVVGFTFRAGAAARAMPVLLGQPRRAGRARCSAFGARRGILVEVTLPATVRTVGRRNSS